MCNFLPCCRGATVGSSVVGGFVVVVGSAKQIFIHTTKSDSATIRLITIYSNLTKHRFKQLYGLIPQL